MLKFLHAADIHLDSSPQNLPVYEGAPVDEVRDATRRALVNLVDLALDQRVHFLLVAGDLYDGDWKDHNTGLFFTKQMSRLRDAGIPVLLIRGNHDAANKMTMSLRLPDNVHMFSHQQAETRVLEDLGVAVHGRSFARQAELENMALEYPPAQSGLYNIGLLHTSLAGAEGHEPYAPCTAEDLRNKGYQYWALGHVHQRDDRTYREPAIIFPGNLQGRHIRETGSKGCMLVEVDERHRTQCEFQPLDVFRWHHLELDATGAEDVEAVLERYTSELECAVAEQDGLPVAVRLTVKGRTAAHQMLLERSEAIVQELRNASIVSSSGMVWLEKVCFRTRRDGPESLEMLSEGPLGELLTCVAQLRSDPEQLAQLTSDLAAFRRKLPDELLQGRESLAVDDPAWLSELLEEVEPLLIGRLTSQEDT